MHIFGKRRKSRPPLTGPRGWHLAEQMTSASTQQAQPRLQPKLKIGKPGDRLEQEADWISKQVVAMPQAQSVDDKDSSRLTKSKDDAPQQLLEKNPSLPAHVRQVLTSQGQPLETAVRRYMEPRFGHDFSQVKIYRDAAAASSAASLDALAYTAGNRLVFGRGQYAPQQPWGAQLLAHELSHVVQQRIVDTTPVIQRNIITGRRSSIPIYELQQRGRTTEQVETTRTMRGVSLKLAYNPDTQELTVGFPLIWLFAHAIPDPQRTTYVQQFESSVRRVWNDRFLLQETARPRRRAHVHIVFDNHIITQMQSAAHERAQLSLHGRNRWTMQVSSQAIRESVTRYTSVVQLGSTSMRQRRRSAARLRRQGASFAYPGTGGSRTFTQAAAPHEFGHMIGLGDEYLQGVTDEAPSAARGHITSRIMNVGERVTPDAYAPFALWISGLTSTTWRVGRRIR